MTSEASTVAGPLEYCVASRSHFAEAASGDLAVAHTTDDGTLLAVIDGLGHGPRAADAARAAGNALHAHAGAPATALLERCHHALRHTRGAAISLATVTWQGTLTWVAVGNVQGVVVHATDATRTRLVTRGGVVGLRLPPLRAAEVALGRGDLLAMMTDGVGDAALDDVVASGDPVRGARELVHRHATGADDALLLLAHLTGGLR